METEVTVSDPMFATDPRQAAVARELYAAARDLPLISPHGHVDPRLLADDEPFPDPARLLVVPDRRADAAFLASLVVQDRLPLDEAAETIADLAYHLPKRILRLDGGTAR
jgi:glucuronate isomerase